MNRSFFVAAALAAAPLFAFAEENCLIEAEDFQIKANWGITPDASNSGGAFLRTGASESDALTVVTLPSGGEYRLWVRARDFARLQPRARHYRIVIDGNQAERDAGIHGQDGWRWENVGSMQLTAGDHVIGLHDNSHFSARCDAILLTTGTADPNAAKLTDLAKFRVTPKPVTVTSTNQPAQPPKLNLAQRREVARIGNDQTRLLFFEVADEQGQPYILRETEVARNGAWERVPAEPGKETLYLLYAPQSKLATSEFFPFWSGDAKLEFTLNGKTYQTSGSRNPFIAGKPDLLIPRTCTPKAGGVEIEFETTAGLKATGLWSLQPEHLEAHFSLNFQAGQDGEYSVCFSPFGEWDKAQVAFNLLPPLFNFQRLPDTPTMSVSSTMPHALALVEPKGSPFTYAVAADPGQLSPDWPTVKNSAYGFSLLNSQAKVQPTIFAPVLGSAASKLKTGEAKTISWSVLAEPGDWKATLEYASDRIFGVTDYRHPYGTSLTDAALNIIDLIKEGDHAGWDAKLKGFYNIESDMTVSQSGPLSVISAAMLTRDEDFYVKRALPTIEYTLSRPSPHFAAEQPEIKLYIAEKNMKLTVPSPFYGAAYWQGVDSLLGQKNPWLEAYAYQDGKPRYNSGSSSMPKWSELMGVYRLDPKPELLEQLKTEADRFLEKEVYGRHEMTLGLEPFYNVSFYPYWWDLMDLYELTGEKRYLDAAEEGAFHTIAGLWSQPSTATGNVTVHPGGDVAPKYKIECYKGPSLYRLGYPRKDGDLPEKEVPGWVISRVGLGLEQPCTYFRVDGAPFYNILMSAWAPSLLRVYQYTGRDILQTYARDTIIGRFGNYPGYYTNAYSDRPIAADYPYKGPDITNLYYHHIPIHLAFTVDFLLTEAAVRSQGQIAIPWVKQQGYVWFSNRVYGGAPGKIYNDDGMRLWFNRKAVQVGSDQISYLTARNNHRFDLVLMNEAERAIAPALSLDRKALGIKEDAPYRVTVNGKTEERRGSVDKKVSVPAKGLVVVSFPTRETQAEPEIPVLKAAPVAEKLGGNWGTLHAFRIRSPFGKDSLYAVLDGRPAKGSTVKLILDGEKAVAREVTSYPYEFTVYPWAMDRDLTFHVVCTDPQGHETVSQPLTLKGNL